MTTTEWVPQNRTMDGESHICPHCGYEHGDAWEGATEDVRTMTCDGCGKTLEYWTEFSMTHMTKAIAVDDA